MRDLVIQTTRVPGQNGNMFRTGRNHDVTLPTTTEKAMQEVAEALRSTAAHFQCWVSPVITTCIREFRAAPSSLATSELAAAIRATW